jgi:hypothetical protein
LSAEETLEKRLPSYKISTPNTQKYTFNGDIIIVEDGEPMDEYTDEEREALNRELEGL